MKRSWNMAVAVAALAAVVGMAAAPARADIKIGVVNAARLMQESPQAKAIQEALRSEFAPKQRELQAMQAALKAKQEKYEKDGPTMSADQRTKAEKDLRDGNRDYSQRVNDFQEDVNTRQNDEISRLQSVIVAEVQAYALSQKFDLILTAEGVAYSSAALDITQQVLAGLQAKAATAPAPAAPKPAAPAAPSGK